MVQDGFSRHQFRRLGRAVKAFGDRVWTATGHDLDFV
jgi:hypothetical protein